MPASRRRNATAVSRQAAELTVAVPQVVAHRVTRMALAGPSPSARDKREFTRMVAEKNTAFVQSWQAMALQAVVAQQSLATSMVRAFWGAPLRGTSSAMQAALQVHDAALGVVGKGMGPVHRKAVANAKRLAKTRLR